MFIRFTVVFAVVSLLVTCCNMDDYSVIEIENGYYEGYFNYEDISYWCLIQIEDGNYEEWPSGGALHQKSMGNLTVGTFSVNGETIEFESDSLKFESLFKTDESDMYLPGNYEILFSDNNDSLVFRKEDSNKPITYYVKKKT